MRDSAAEREAGSPPRRSAEVRSGNAALFASAAAYWYLSGAAVALGIWFGFSLAAPGPGARRTGGDVVDALRVSDAEWYAQIATSGYSYDPGSRSSVAFFPLYPLLGRAVAAMLRVRIVTALLIVSNASFLAALAVLAAYIRARFREPPHCADYSLLAAALFPTGCFFRLPYSEATFLLIAVLAMYGMMRGWPRWSNALIVGLATAARPVGVALLAPLAIDVWARERSFRGRLLALAVWLPLGCWGLLGYMAYQHRAFGDALAFVKTQRHWGILPAPSPPRRLWECATLKPIVEVYRPRSAAYWARRDGHSVFSLSLTFANPILFVGAAGLVVAGASRRVNWLNRREASLAALLLLIPYLTRGPEMGMASMGRFVAVAFPIYIVLGRVLRSLPSAAAAVLSTPQQLCYNTIQCVCKWDDDNQDWYCDNGNRAPTPVNVCIYGAPGSPHGDGN